MDGKQEFDAVGPRADSVGAEAVTVPVFGTDTEVPVLGKERWEQVQRLHGVHGMNISQIARATDLDRKTVRRCVRKAQWQAYRREVAAATLMSAHAAWLAERAPQVRYSARILFQELSAARGYTGGYDTVKIAVRPLRAQATLDSLTQCRFETAPGEQSQVDWGQVRVAFDSGLAEIHVFVMTLGYARRAYAEGFEHERIGALLAAHEHAFEHFGGHTAELLYDRMRTVIQGEHDGAKRWNPTFKAFAEYWGFEPRVCRPYRAQTKGKVESGVKYVKRNFLPGRRFRDLADFNDQLRAWLAEVADVRARHHAPAADRSLCRRSRSACAHRRATEFPCGNGARSGGGRRLARLDRHQPLLGALHPDRQDRAGGARWGAVADLSSRQARCRAPGARQPVRTERRPGARAWRHRTQRPQALRHAGCAGAEGREAAP